MKGKILAAVLLITLFVLPIASTMVSAASPEKVYVDKIIIQRIEDDQAALQSLQQGGTQARLFTIGDRDLAKQMAQQGFNVYRALSGMTNILVNPTDTCKDGSFNLFQYREARLALQFLIPRDEIVSNVYKGEAYPLIIPWPPLHPDYPYMLAAALKWDALIKTMGEEYGYQLLEKALKKAGAVKNPDTGLWEIDGSPVTIKFVIRIEDERKDIGDMIADKLENFGLKVERLYKDFAGAKQIVYRGDPASCEWNLYTEGWGIVGITKYDYGNFVWFYSSIWGAMPGWLNSAFWNYKNATIDEIAEKLDMGEYKTEEEYWELVNKGVDLAVQESVRVFIAATYDYYIASGDLEGVLPSPIASPWHTFSFMNLKYTSPEVKMSNRYVYSPGWAWNPVAGWEDMYSRPVVEAVTWRGVTSRVTDGETGWSPAGTTTYEVVRGPLGIPSDAITYDPVKHKFVSASEAGVFVAKNKVIFNYKLLGKIKFHDGTTATVADILAPIYLIKEWAHQAENDPRYESPLEGDYATFLATFKAIRILNDTAVEVYTDFSHVDDGMIAQIVDVWSNFPLELYAAMEELALNGIATFTPEESEATGKPQIHLLSTDLCEQALSLLEGDTPDWVQQLIDLGYLTEDEWNTRVQNLVNFYTNYHQLVVGVGPFMITDYDATNDVITLERVPDFPVDPAVLAEEMRPRVIDLEAIAAEVVEAIPGTPVAQLTLTIEGQPVDPEHAKVYGLLVNLETYEAAFLDIKYEGDGVYTASLPRCPCLLPGDYILAVLAYPVGYSQPSTYYGTLSVTPVVVTETVTHTEIHTETVTHTETTTVPGPTVTSPVTTTVTKTPGSVIAGAVIAIIVVGALAYLAGRRS